MCLPKIKKSRSDSAEPPFECPAPSLGPFLGVVLLASGPGTGNDLWVGEATPLVVFAGGSGDSDNSLHKYIWSPLSVQKSEESNNSILAGRGYFLSHVESDSCS